MRLLKFKGRNNYEEAVPVGKINYIEKMDRDDPANFDGDGNNYGCLIVTGRFILYCREDYEDIIARFEKVEENETD